MSQYESGPLRCPECQRAFGSMGPPRDQCFACGDVVCFECLVRKDYECIHCDSKKRDERLRKSHPHLYRRVLIKGVESWERTDQKRADQKRGKKTVAIPSDCKDAFDMLMRAEKRSKQE